MLGVILAGGGSSVYAKLNIHKGVYTLKIEQTDIHWVRLDKHFFKLQKDIYLTTVYISHKIHLVVSLI